MSVQFCFFSAPVWIAYFIYLLEPGNAARAVSTLIMRFGKRELQKRKKMFADSRGSEGELNVAERV